MDYSKGSSDNNIQFTGKEIDSESGLTYFGARYYNPVIGRWISRDTLSGKITIPQSLNRYLYCYNNPLNYIDKTGHQATVIPTPYGPMPIPIIVSPDPYMPINFLLIAIILLTLKMKKR